MLKLNKNTQIYGVYKGKGWEYYKLPLKTQPT